MNDFPRSLKKGDQITYRIYGGDYYGVVKGLAADVHGGDDGYVADLYSAGGSEYFDYRILPRAGGVLRPSANLYDLDPIT